MEEHGGRDAGHEGGRHAQEPPAQRADRARPAPGAGPPRAKVAALADARARANLEIADGLVHDTPIEAPGLIRVSDQEAVVADRVDDARNAVRVRDDLLEGVVREDA